MKESFPNAAKGETNEERETHELKQRLPKISREEIDRLLAAMGDEKVLSGREVLIPAFGSDVAFFEGELCPESKESSKADATEEMVYVSTNHDAETSSIDPSKLADEKDVLHVSFSDALKWLQQHSSESSLANLKSTKPKATPPKPSKSKPKQRKFDAIPKVSEDSSPMFNINEEYDSSGKRIVGEAVNLSSRLQAVYGEKNDRAQFHSDETKGEEPDDEQEASKTTKAKISDEEYNKISKRLEELALLEEEEARNAKQNASKPKKTTTHKSSSSFGFKKGFLNKSTKKKKNPKPADPLPRQSSNEMEHKNTGVRARIDTSQNKIHEIPREGRQQPLPPKKSNTTSLLEDSSSIVSELSSASSRILDASVFSGQVSERATQSVISAETASRLAANEQTQNLQRALQQPKAKPKRVSRFKQQRQQEQMQG